MGKATWQPKWWKPEIHGSGWERVKEALKRDWEQTKNDLGVKGARDLNQDIGDTVAQATGGEPIPFGPNTDGRAPGRTWDDVEVGVRYGYGAQREYGGQFRTWNEDLERTLKNDWEAAGDKTGRRWDDARDDVRRGFEHRH